MYSIVREQVYLALIYINFFFIHIIYIILFFYAYSIIYHPPKTLVSLLALSSPLFLFLSHLFCH
jgi:hypothetical protein